MALTNHKELRLILKEAQSRGWLFTKRRKHIFGKHPSGRTATIAATPSDHRALLNIRRHLGILITRYQTAPESTPNSTGSTQQKFPST